MKATRLATAISLALFLTILVSAQVRVDKSAPRDLVVLEKSWHKEVHHQDRDPNPLRPNEDLIRQTRAQKTFIRNRDYDLPSPIEPRMPMVTPRPLIAGVRPFEVYVYKFKVQNTGVKKIRSIEWEYQFLHPDTGEVMGSRRIVSKVKLSPGKTQVVQAKLLQKPTNIVSADQLDKKPRDQFEERLLIHRIDYADRTVWQRGP